MTLGNVETVQGMQLCNMYKQHKKQRIFRLGLIAKKERKIQFARNLCKKRNTRIDKGVLCPSCCSPIYRRCCTLKNSDVLDLTKTTLDRTGNIPSVQVLSFLLA